MDCNGLSLYNVATSLDLDALTQGKSGNSDDHEEESDDGEDEEIQQRNAELQDLLTNAFDDLIEEDESDTSNHHCSNYLSGASYDHHPHHSSTEHNSSDNKVYQDSLYSPLHLKDGNLSETQYNHVGHESSSNSLGHMPLRTKKKNSVQFHSSEENLIKPYKSNWHQAPEDENENRYISSGLNSQKELEVLFETQSSEIAKLKTEIHHLHHKVALLEGDKTGMQITMGTKDKLLQESHAENQLLKKEIRDLKEQLVEVTVSNQESSVKLQAAENNIMTLERQLIDLNLAQANYKDSNKQDNLLGVIKAKYEKDLNSLRDELNRLRTEIDFKNENISILEKKLRDVTEMHERTLTERASNLLEFNRALDQQRVLREQRDTLTSAALLEQLSKAQEEIERLRSNQLRSNMSDSMAQMQLGSSREQRETKQNHLIIQNLEQRLKTSENTVLQLEERVVQLQHEKEALSSDMQAMKETSYKTSTPATIDQGKLLVELDNVRELYLVVCREKDVLEDELSKLNSDRNKVEDQNKKLLKDLEHVSKNMEESLSRHKELLEENFNSKLQMAIQEHLTRTRLDIVQEKNRGDGDSVQIERSLEEMQCLRESMDILRKERDDLQRELMNRQEQLKIERNLLREKFEVEKEMLIKKWQEKVTVSLSASNKSTMQSTDKTLITATADAMARLRQQCEEEKLSIITGYEKQMLELQSKFSAPLLIEVEPSKAQITQDWKSDVLRVKMSLKTSQFASLLPVLDGVVLKVEKLLLSDEKTMKDQTEKYKQLKRRVREYQKYVNDKLTKHKNDRQQSEDYCRLVISDLLGRVTQELQLLEQNRLAVDEHSDPSHAKVPCVSGLPSRSSSTSKARVQTATSTPNGHLAGNFVQPPFGLTFAEGIDNLQQQVNLYMRGLTNFNAVNK